MSKRAWPYIVVREIAIRGEGNPFVYSLPPAISKVPPLIVDIFCSVDIGRSSVGEGLISKGPWTSLKGTHPPDPPLPCIHRWLIV